MTSRQPALFIGHGSPMLAITKDDPVIQNWKRIAESIPRPKAIVVISAHWFVGENCVTAQERPRTIHDFGRFPQELFDVQYPAPGSPELAERVANIVADANGGNRPRLDRDSWGLDHGAWSVLRHMYPEADIPVIQLSMDARKPSSYHYKLGRALSQLRDEGVLILGSGNLVHNFATMSETQETPSGAQEFIRWIKDVTLDKSVDRSDLENYPIIHWQTHAYGLLAQNGPDHFLPSLYVLGAAAQDEDVTWSSETWTMGTLSMACMQVG